jgi:hypothetical protein
MKKNRKYKTIVAEPHYVDASSAPGKTFLRLRLLPYYTVYQANFLKQTEINTRVWDIFSSNLNC